MWQVAGIPTLIGTTTSPRVIGPFLRVLEKQQLALIFGNEAGSSELVPGMDEVRLLTQHPSADGRQVRILPSAQGTAADRQLSIPHPPLEGMGEAGSSKGSQCCCPRSQ